MIQNEDLSPVVHEHHWTFYRTDSDWYDGDEEDIYKCECGETQRRYIPR